MTSKITAMRVVVVLDNVITLEKFKESLPTQYKYFVCQMATEKQLRQTLKEYGDDYFFSRLRGSNGYMVDGYAGIAIGVYIVDDIQYSIWGPGSGHTDVKDLVANKGLIDEAIRNARDQDIPEPYNDVEVNEMEISRKYQNVDGIDVETGPDGVTVYCGRELGPTVFRFKGELNDGICGPSEGPNCPACIITQGVYCIPKLVYL
jgi:hypothetical protein